MKLFGYNIVKCTLYTWQSMKRAISDRATGWVRRPLLTVPFPPTTQEKEDEQTGNIYIGAI